jgi:hypothetical protein
VDLGQPQLVDGFANGWHVSSEDLHALGGANFTVTLTWAPQQLVWLALAVSGATLLLCLVLGFLPIRWRRWLRARLLPRRLRGPAGPDAPERPSDPFDAPSLTLPYSVPSLGEPRRGWLRFPRALVLGAATGGVALLVAPPLAALAVGVLVAVGLVLRWARAVAVIAGIAFVVAGCLNVVQGQRIHHYLPGSNWDGFFVHAGNLIWIGVVLLVADAVISSFGLRVRKPVRRRQLRAVPVPVLVAVGAGVDAGTTDAGTTEAGTTDAGTTEAGTTDAGTTDAGTTDAGTTDAGTTDAGTTDAGTTDAGTTDAGSESGPPADDPP